MRVQQKDYCFRENNIYSDEKFNNKKQSRQWNNN